jgi:hypothetical protein
MVDDSTLIFIFYIFQVSDAVFVTTAYRILSTGDSSAVTLEVEKEIEGKELRRRFIWTNRGGLSQKLPINSLTQVNSKFGRFHLTEIVFISLGLLELNNQLIFRLRKMTLTI